MAFPHPQSRKDHYRNEDKPSSGSIVWNLVKWTIDITEYRNGKDDVNPAKNRTFGGLFHISLSSIYRRHRVIYSGLTSNCAGRFQCIRAKTCYSAAKSLAPGCAPYFTAAVAVTMAAAIASL
jgi:hypothetical protein